MKKNPINLLLLLSGLLLCACTGLRKLPPGEKLYTGYSVKLEHSGKLKNKAAIQKELKRVVRPKENKSFLGMRPRLWLWNYAGEGKKGLKKWLKKKGEAPVYLSSVKPAEVTKNMDAALFNIGIFNAVTGFKVVQRKRSAKLIYTAAVHEAFRLNELIYDIPAALAQIVRSEKSLLQPGDAYSLEKLEEERGRMDELLKDQGYYLFRPEYLLFKADTNARDKTVLLILTLKEETPARALKVYRINDIHIHTNTAENDSLEKHSHAAAHQGIHFSGDNKVRESVLIRAMALSPGNTYSRRLHNATLSRLMGMGAYKFVRIRFDELDSAGHQLLDMRVQLSPMPKRTLRSEFSLVSKSNDFAGPHLDLNYTNRNSFNGAERLDLSMGGSFETQISGKYKNLFSYSFDSKAEITVPRFVLPFRLSNVSSFFIPRTRFMLGYSYLRRVGYFDMRSIQAVYGFMWKENRLKEHQLNPVNVNITATTRQTPEFSALLEVNPFIKRSYEQQFVAGALYSFIYNEQVLKERVNQAYYHLTAESSGNLVSLLASSIGRLPNPENPARILGIPYSQFVKLSSDLRNYRNFPHSSVVARFFAGAAKPYGNSLALPYVKQFFSGGPNSVRAFPINSIGPGTYSALTQAAFFLQQGGDIKLEGNLEYRFDILGALKGALFADAGNVWLASTDASRAEAFVLSRFYKELALGAGLGLRYDLSFFVIRVDLATPLRKPWLPENQRWVYRQFKLSDARWRSENLLLNLAIGYPF